MTLKERHSFKSLKLYMAVWQKLANSSSSVSWKCTPYAEGLQDNQHQAQRKFGLHSCQLGQLISFFKAKHSLILKKVIHSNR